MTVYDIVEILNPDVVLIIFNIDGKRIYSGTRSTYINYAEEDILSAEVQELSTTYHGAMTATII